MNKTRLSFYQEKLNKLVADYKEIKRKHAVISIMRLIVFLSAVLSWFYIITININLGIGLGIGSMLAFIFLLKWHKRVDDRKVIIETLIAINKNEISCCNGQFNQFQAGDEFVDHNHAYSYDIDLFGQGSLFQYVNRTVTHSGTQNLAKWLAFTPLDKTVINQHQLAVSELSQMVDYRQKFQAKGSILVTRQSEAEQIKNWLGAPSFFKHSVLLKIVLVSMPIVVIGAILAASFGFSSWSIVGYLGLLNLVIIGTRLKKFNLYYQVVSSCHVHLVKIQNLIQIIDEQDFNSKHLQSLKQKFYKEEKKSATKQVNELTRLLNNLDNRNNIILGFLLNGLFLWDWQYAYRIEKWQHTHQVDFSVWMDSIGQIDALNSLANLYFNNPEFNFPTCSEKEFEFNVEQLGHPILDSNIRICNNFNIDQHVRFSIVTGANMAGKSTFLRTVAVNLVLAGCGAPVCAKKFSFTPLPLYTSMRTEDSLMKNESYFFAELKRLQKITKALENGEKLFIILDEILRGTNSEDKRKGSIGFVKKITQNQAHGLVATHDLELARLAEQQPNIFKALCFEVTLKNNELQFDYKLQPGVTQNMNASFLMYQMGIIDG